MSYPVTIPSQCEVVIIGSGIMGLSTAFHLARSGVQDIVVLDRGPLGGVASPRAAGLLRHHYSHALPIELALRGREFYANFRAHTGYDVGFVPNGYFLGVGRDDADFLESTVKMARSIGVDTRLVSAAETREYFPEINPMGWDGPIAFDRSAAYVQPRLVMQGFIAAARDMGVHLIEGVAVTGIDQTAGRVTGVWTDTGVLIQTNVVVNAAGAWAGKVAAMADVEIPITVNRLLQIFEIRPPFAVLTTNPSLSTAVLDLYARPNPGNRILVGSRKYFDSPQDPDTVDLTYSVDDLQASRVRYARLVPDAGRASAYQAWAAIDGDTPDFQPILGEVPQRPGLVLAAGGSAHAFKLGPILGQLLAELITTGAARTMDISPFSLSRFEAGKLFPRGYKQMGA